MRPARSFVAAACALSLCSCSTMMPPSVGTRAATAIDPARVTIGEIAWRAPPDPNISEEERDLLLRELGDELTAHVRELPAVPQGHPAVLRAAITRVDTVSPALNTVSTLLLFAPLDGGGAAVDIEAIDAGTGGRLAWLTLGYTPPLAELKARFDKLAPARLALRKAATDLTILLGPPPHP